MIIAWVENRPEFCAHQDRDFFSTRATQHGHQTRLRLATVAVHCKLHTHVLPPLCTHGQTKERWQKCTGCPNARQARILVHCTSAARPSRLPNCCDPVRHLRDLWLRGLHCARTGPAPDGLRAGSGATCGSATRVMPHELVSIAVVEQT